MTTMNVELRGVLPVLQTPYTANENIDFEVLHREIDWVLSHGANGVVVAMVSEILRLSSDERCDLTRAVCQAVDGRGATVISVGAESSILAERFARQAADSGATALMAIPPTTAALADGQIIKYFSRIFDATDLPLVVQDASGYVGRPLSVELQQRLLEKYQGRIYFKPEAPPIGQRLSALRDATNGEAKIFEGSGGLHLVDSFRRGIVGTMPGSELIRVIVPLWRALTGENEESVRKLALPVAALVSLQTSLDSYLAVEKHLLVRQGVFKNTLVRGPVAFELDRETKEEVDRLFDLLMSVL